MILSPFESWKWALQNDVGGFGVNHPKWCWNRDFKRYIFDDFRWNWDETRWKWWVLSLHSTKSPKSIDFHPNFTKKHRKYIIWNRDFSIISDDLPNNNLHHLVELTLSFRMVKESSPNSISIVFSGWFCEGWWFLSFLKKWVSSFFVSNWCYFVL